HFFTQIPQPIQSTSEMNAILSEDLTSIHRRPGTRGVTHRFGRHLLASMMAMRVFSSAILNRYARGYKNYATIKSEESDRRGPLSQSPNARSQGRR
ncbi:hypothetical protein DL93DRAFT_2060545, partial [Clavulina sp. PMI_390]